MIIIQFITDPPIEISISVPNLSDLSMSLDRTLVADDAMTIETSVSETETETRNYKKLNMIKMERRAKNREKLMAMKRFSGFLKRPEILGNCLEERKHTLLYKTSLSETVYSVEEEEKQKSEEKPDEDPAVTSPDDNEDKTCRDALARTQEADSADTEKGIAEREDDIETTEYDISTDDDSLRMIYSSTDQVNTKYE